LNLLENIKTALTESNITVKQSFKSEGCNEYEFFNFDNRKIGYVVEYLDDSNSASHGELLYYEFYYDNSNETDNYEDDDFLGCNEYNDLERLLADIEDFAYWN